MGWLILTVIFLFLVLISIVPLPLYVLAKKHRLNLTLWDLTRLRMAKKVPHIDFVASMILCKHKDVEITIEELIKVYDEQINPVDYIEKVKQNPDQREKILEELKNKKN